MIQHDQLVMEQIAYYQARATEYDEWFYRTGRYDRGAEHTANWFAEADTVRSRLKGLFPLRDVLEFAPGTGIWTQELVQGATSVLAVDASAEMLTINQNKLQSNLVTYQQADIFRWQPDRQYDFICFSFWLSHVPPERFDEFWRLVQSALAPNGRVFFVDSLYTQISTAKDQFLREKDDTIVTRRLNDGREFEIVKVFYQPKLLQTQLTELGWRVVVGQTENFFLYGTAERGC